MFGMPRVVWRPRDLSTDVSILAGTLLVFVVLIWTLEFYNIRIVESRVMLQVHAEFRVWDVSNVVAPTDLYITNNLSGVIKLMIRLTSLDSRQRRGNHVPIPSSVLTAKVIIKLIQINVPSGSTDSTENGIQKNTLKFMKVANNQFAHLWMVTNHDYQGY